jgi:hypothetical protein
LPNIADLKQVFNIAKAGNGPEGEQVLCVRVGEKHFGFAISSGRTEQASNELLRLVWYGGEQIQNHELEELYSGHPELKDMFSKVLIAYDHPQSVLVPPASHAGNDRLLLEMMYGINGSHSIIAEDIAGWQLKNIFAVPTPVKEWAIRHFPEAHFYHGYSIGVKLIDNTAMEGSLLVDFRSNDFTVIASKGNRLLMAQTFSYTTPDDVIYYLVKICTEFGFSQQQVKIAITGLVEKESNLYRDLVQYFLNIRFREPSWLLPIKEEDNYPSHFFTSLNDLALCES